VKEKVAVILWQSHSIVNSEYRKTLNRLKSSQLSAQARKVDKLYTSFLRTSQYFYKGYIQRLSARYQLPELERMANGIKAESMTIDNPSDSVSAELRTSILESCHSTLIHLGDLSRYRSQARHKVPSYETALTYYSLADDLIPNSGYAHHQMGIIYLDEKRHLDIVYHFYRALAVEHPHPNAMQNLEAEFKTLQLPSTPARRSSRPDPQDAFILWFVRLHAHFYKGEPFSQHKEMEDEVLGRLEMATRLPETLGILLKMVMINISAYHVANTKLQGGSK
jgi:protein SMG7